MKGKKLVRKRTSRSSPKSARQSVLERALEVGERDAPVDGEALDLVEDREVLRVGRVAAVDAAEGDHVRPAAARDSITRICAGEVWVRRTMSPSGRACAAASAGRGPAAC